MAVELPLIASGLDGEIVYFLKGSSPLPSAHSHHEGQDDPTSRTQEYKASNHKFDHIPLFLPPSADTMPGFAFLEMSMERIHRLLSNTRNQDLSSRNARTLDILLRVALFLCCCCCRRRRRRRRCCCC